MSQGFQAFDVDDIVFPSAMRVVRPVLPVSVLARSRLRLRTTFEWCAPARRAAYRSLTNSTCSTNRIVKSTLDVTPSCSCVGILAVTCLSRVNATEMQPTADYIGTASPGRLLARVLTQTHTANNILAYTNANLTTYAQYVEAAGGVAEGHAFPKNRLIDTC